MTYSKKLIGYKQKPVDQSNWVLIGIDDARERLQGYIDDLKVSTGEVDNEMYRDIVENKGKNTINQFTKYFKSIQLHPVASKREEQLIEHSNKLSTLRQRCTNVYNAILDNQYGIDLNTFEVNNSKVKAINSTVDKLEKAHRAIYLESKEEENLYNKAIEMAKQLNELETQLRDKYYYKDILAPEQMGVSAIKPTETQTFIRDNKGAITVNINYFSHKV